MFIGNRGIVYGCTSSFRMIDLLKFTFDPGKLPATGLRKWIATVFVERLRKCFDERGFQTTQEGQRRGGEFLCAVRGRLFLVGCDYATHEVTGSAALGSRAGLCARFSPCDAGGSAPTPCRGRLAGR